jgi:hypothetical protein
LRSTRRPSAADLLDARGSGGTPTPGTPTSEPHPHHLPAAATTAREGDARATRQRADWGAAAASTEALCVVVFDGGAVGLQPAQVSVDLSEFVTARVVEAPLECVTWEAVAAEEGRSLAEWIYAQTLALTAP